MSHTLSRLLVTELDRIVPDSDKDLNDGYFIADCYGPDAKANARRLAACWNVCQGVSTEMLEASDHGCVGAILRETISSSRERDTYRDLCGELLAALKNTCALVDKMGPKSRAQADSVITKAEEIMGENSNG